MRSWRVRENPKSVVREEITRITGKENWSQDWPIPIFLAQKTSNSCFFLSFVPKGESATSLWTSLSCSPSVLLLLVASPLIRSNSIIRRHGGVHKGEDTHTHTQTQRERERDREREREGHVRPIFAHFSRGARMNVRELVGRP
jgi:hypothetical protein